MIQPLSNDGGPFDCRCLFTGGLSHKLTSKQNAQQSNTVKISDVTFLVSFFLDYENIMKILPKMFLHATKIVSHWWKDAFSQRFQDCVTVRSKALMMSPNGAPSVALPLLRDLVTPMLQGSADTSEASHAEGGHCCYHHS